MVFVWDDLKNRTNQRKHDVSFETAAIAFYDPGAISYPDRFVDGDERWHLVGIVGSMTLLLVVHTIREEHGEEEIRIISARKANRRERALYDAPV